MYDLFTFSALAGILVWPLCALGTIFARRAGTLVNVYLAVIPSKAWKNNKRVLLCACEHEGHTERVYLKAVLPIILSTYDKSSQ